MSPFRVAERVWIEAEVECVWEDNGHSYARLHIPHALVMDAKVRHRVNGPWIYDPTVPVDHLIRSHPSAITSNTSNAS